MRKVEVILANHCMLPIRYFGRVLAVIRSNIQFSRFDLRLGELFIKKGGRSKTACRVYGPSVDMIHGIRKGRSSLNPFENVYVVRFHVDCRGKSVPVGVLC